MIRPQPRADALVRQQTPKIGRHTKLRLDINENTVGWPADVIAALCARLTPTSLASYPETYNLYAALARQHEVTADHILVGAGSELVIRYLFEAFLEPGADLVVLEPSFAMFEVYGRLYGANVVKVPVDECLAVDVNRLMAAITPSARIVAIPNPNNPTGTVFTEQELVAVIARASDQGCVALIDEAYYYFYPGTMAPLVGRFDNLVVTRTFSKAFGLAGLRLGYAVGAPAVIAAAQKVQPIDHASTVAVLFGEYAVEHEEIAWEYARQVREGKTYLVDALRALDLRVTDGYANFILVDLGPDRDPIVLQLQDRILLGTSVRLPFPNSFVKITAGTRPQMETLVDALRPLLPAVARQA